MMPDAQTVAAVRVFVPKASANERRRQLQAVLTLLRDQLRVRGLTVVACVQWMDQGRAVAVGAVGDDVGHDHDPPLVIEFFDEPDAADRARRMLQDLLPECGTMWWRASTDSAAPATPVLPAAAREQRRPLSDPTRGGRDETERDGSPAPQPGAGGTAIAEPQKVSRFEPPAWMDSLLCGPFGEEHANLVAEGEGDAAAILQRIVLAPECEQMWEDIRCGRGRCHGDGPVPQILDPRVRSELKKDEAVRGYVEKLESWLAHLPDPMSLIRAYGFAHAAAEAAQIADLPIGSPRAETLAAAGVLAANASIRTIREAKRWMRSRVEARLGPQTGPVLHCPTKRVREECLIFFVQGILMREVGAIHHPTLAALASAALGTHVNMWKLRTIIERLEKRQAKGRGILPASLTSSFPV